jgi:peptidyl-prolyl cis-trans isomerase D
VGAGFVGWGAYSFSANKGTTLAKVGKRDITQKDLQSSYNNIYNYYNQMLGGKLTQEKADELKLQDIALEQLINENILLSYADEKGITALESEIVTQIQNIDNFKKDGKFDKDTYFKVLKAINKEPKEFEEDIKKEIIVKKLSDALKMPSTELEVETLGSALYLQDKLKVKLIDIKSGDIDIDDKELKSYWNDHKDDYMSETSYTIEQIKVSSSDIKVDDEKVKEFYNDNRNLFKGDDDKILSFEDAKADVIKKLQHKLAKKEALKKYLSFKAGKIKADETKTITSKDSDIPLEKIATAKVGSYIKAIKLKDGYMTAKLIKINKPKPLEFEKAKDLAYNALFKSKKQQLLESRAKKESSDLKDAKTTEYLTRDDVQKVAMLSPNEARAFLTYLFAQHNKNGFYIFSDKAIAYEIVDQKLVSAEKLKTDKDKLKKNIESIKTDTIRNSLIKQLKNRYKIEKYYKG